MFVLLGRSPMAHRVVKVGNSQQLRRAGVGVAFAMSIEEFGGRQ